MLVGVFNRISLQVGRGKRLFVWSAPFICQMLFHHGSHHQSSTLTDQRSVTACCASGHLSCSLPSRGLSDGVDIVWLAANCSPYPMSNWRKVSGRGGGDSGRCNFLLFFLLLSLPPCPFGNPHLHQLYHWHSVFLAWRPRPLAEEELRYYVHWFFLAPSMTCSPSFLLI